LLPVGEKDRLWLAVKRPRALLLPLFLISLVSCTTAPYTGRSQFMLISESREVNIGGEAYRYILRDSVLSQHPEALRLVRKVGEKIAQVANKPDYKWEFNVIDDPEMANAFAISGGKVAVYTGIFPVAQDEVGLAVVLGHEVAHALARHAGERMSQGMLVQLGGLGLAVALGSNPELAKPVLGAYGLGASVGVILPFSRSQESEADRIGLILMAKAGYDPRVALELWERMEKKDKKQDSPPEFLSTHPGYEARTQRIRDSLPEALKFYEPGEQGERLLPLEAVDSPTARAERDLLKKIQAVNKQAGNPRGERAVLEVMGAKLRVDPALLYQERKESGLGYGQYAALRTTSHLGKAPFSRILADYREGLSWSRIAENHGTHLSELSSFIEELLRTAATAQSPPRLFGLP